MRDPSQGDMRLLVACRIFFFMWQVFLFLFLIHFVCLIYGRSERKILFFSFHHVITAAVYYHCSISRYDVRLHRRKKIISLIS